MYIQIPGLSGELAMTAVLTGLRSGMFLDDLTLRPPRSFNELLQRARRFMALEDQTGAHVISDSRVRRRQETSGDDGDDSPERRHHRDGGSRRHRSGPQEERTPQAPLTEQVFMGSDDLREFTQEQHCWEQRPSGSRRSRRRRKWCMLHKECGHNSEDCRDLKDQRTQTD
ncbi:hypothetical protein Dimus_039716 [Dionaea muscipula]